MDRRNLWIKGREFDYKKECVTIKKKQKLAISKKQTGIESDEKLKE